ncbi:MAG: hypothetical protein VKJ06_05790 [Vampirovibrionales bacterium]|nr:hypothetical protein [Vampirovibrionales bacterium]
MSAFKGSQKRNPVAGTHPKLQEQPGTHARGETVKVPRIMLKRPCAISALVRSAARVLILGTHPISEA